LKKRVPSIREGKRKEKTKRGKIYAQWKTGKKRGGGVLAQGKGGGEGTRDEEGEKRGTTTKI